MVWKFVPEYVSVESVSRIGREDLLLVVKVEGGIGGPAGGGHRQELTLYLDEDERREFDALVQRAALRTVRQLVLLAAEQVTA